MAQALDRNTGLPMNLPSLASTVPVTQTTTTGPKAEQGTSTGTERTVAAAQSVTSQINTTPGALQALESLISSLSDRPAISDAELNAKFPMATMQFNPTTGWYNVDPKTGIYMSPQEAQAFNAKQQAARQQAVQAAGIIPGGTAAQKEQQAERQTEIQRNRQTQQQYNKGAAVNDANALITKAVQDALEAALPQITAGLEGAGTSRSTIAAGLTQKAALKGATEGAALGANLSAQYGAINTQLAGVLEMLTRSDPNSPAAMLLQAIIGSKGLVSAGSTAGTTTTATTKTANTNAQTSPQQQVAERNPLLPSPLAGFGGTNAAQVPTSVAANQYAFSEGNELPVSSLDQTYQSLFNAPDADTLFAVGEE